MRRILLTLLLLLAASASAQMGVSDGHDLDALWTRAAAYGLDDLDAVLLLESHEITLAGADRTTRIHRVVWIGTRAGLGSHADLRIPWNADCATLEVKKLRTWRDGRWWPDAEAVSPTAVVETLPYAVDRAGDYAGMRETMLLHDGVELPCIMETEYVVSERGVLHGGDDGLFVFPQRDPAVRTVLTISSRPTPVKAITHNGAPAPVVDGGVRTWTLEDVPRLRLPLTGDPAAYEPCVRWSSWESWRQAGTAYADAMQRAARLDDATRVELAERLKPALSDFEKLQAVIAYADETVASVHYDARRWGLALRDAARVRDTGYAHDHDRTAYLLALLETAGLQPRPQFEFTTRGSFDAELPGFAAWTDLQLRVDRAGPGLLLDPVTGAITATRDFDRRTRWDPIWSDAPESMGDHRFPRSTIDRDDPAATTLDPDDMEILADPGLLHVSLDLTTADDGWSGRGFVKAEHALSLWPEAVGTDGELAQALDDRVGSILADATLTDHGVTVFTPEAVEAGVTFDLAAPTPDDRGRTALIIGDPTGGLLARLPHDVDVAVERRESPILLGTHLAQVVRVRIETGGRGLVAVPRPSELLNAAGLFRLTVEKSDDAIVIERWLSLGPGPLPAAEWPDLRALLLEETDLVHRTILFE